MLSNVAGLYVPELHLHQILFFFESEDHIIQPRLLLRHDQALSSLQLQPVLFDFAHLMHFILGWLLSHSLGCIEKTMFNLLQRTLHLECVRQIVSAVDTVVWNGPKYWRIT